MAAATTTIAMNTTTMAMNTTTIASTPEPVLDSGDNAWVMVSTALVLLMTPALAFFYGGLVHRKNLLNQLFLSFICMGIVFVQWVLFGFSFVFGPPISSGFGSFGDAALRFGERLDPDNSPTYPLLTFAAFQGTFAIITAAIISGAIVGRMKLIPYMIFVFIWTTVCYDPLAHWVFAPSGFLRRLGTLDFAGGTVVHISSGVAGFVASLILGRRIDFKPHESTPHNIPFAVLGACLLWIGWIGFNAGSAGAANGVAALALVNTIAAAAAGLLTWTVLDAIRGRVSVAGACASPIIGLVSITPACGYVDPGWSILFGIIPNVIIYIIFLFKRYLIFDDTLDVFIIHGIGGIIGAFLTGLFASIDNNPAGADGAFYGHPVQMWYQVAGILTTIAFSAACTAGILLPLKYTIGIRLSPEEELRGVDWIAHGEGWEVVEKSRQGLKTQALVAAQTTQLPPSSNRTDFHTTRISSRSRPSQKRRSLVRLQSDVRRSRINASLEANANLP